MGGLPVARKPADANVASADHGSRVVGNLELCSFLTIDDPRWWIDSCVS